MVFRLRPMVFRRCPTRCARLAVPDSLCPTRPRQRQPTSASHASSPIRAEGWGLLASVPPPSSSCPPLLGFVLRSSRPWPALLCSADLPVFLRRSAALPAFLKRLAVLPISRRPVPPSARPLLDQPALSLADRLPLLDSTPSPPARTFLPVGWCFPPGLLLLCLYPAFPALPGFPGSTRLSRLYPALLALPGSLGADLPLAALPSPTPLGVRPLLPALRASSPCLLSLRASALRASAFRLAAVPPCRLAALRLAALPPCRLAALPPCALRLAPCRLAALPPCRLAALRLAAVRLPPRALPPCVLRASVFRLAGIGPLPSALPAVVALLGGVAIRAVVVGGGSEACSIRVGSTSYRHWPHSARWAPAATAVCEGGGPIWRPGEHRVMFWEPAGKRARRAGRATQTRSGRPAKPQRRAARSIV
ncbi:hypothetical protein J3R03_007931 [Actinoplanes couchii]|nr:hypothetical protein [Actinoplanes couchii]